MEQPGDIKQKGKKKGLGENAQGSNSSFASPLPPNGAPNLPNRIAVEKAVSANPTDAAGLENGHALTAESIDREGTEGVEPTASSSEKGHLKIGDLARLTQKTVRTLHFYEELDILRPVERTRGGFRLYSPESVERVWLIDKLQVLGLSLPEIRDMLLEWEESETGARAAHAIMASLLERRRKLREELERLHALELELNATLDYLHHCTTGCGRQTAPLKCPTCDHAAREEKRPRMISGLYPH